MATTVFAESPVQMESNNAYPTFSNGLNVPTSIYDDQRALQNIAVELSKYGFATTMTSSSSPTDHLLHQNAMINGNSLDCHSSNSSDHGYSDADLFNLSQRKSQNTTECVPVPSSEHVAEIVGRQGCKIKALRAKTNTYIKTPVRGEEPVFVVTGRKEDVESAKQEILSAADHFTQIRASRRHSQGGIPAPGHITAYVRVPYKLVGLVVGPKGATIKRIQQLTHTYIITPSRDKEPIFEVTGLPDNVETARSEIEVHIASRTGSYSPSFDSNGGKQNDPSSGVFNEFHMNGTDTYGDVVVNEFAGSTDSLLTKNLSKLSLNHQHPLIGGQHHHLQQSSTQINNVSAQQHYGAASMNLLQSQVQNGCNAWLSYANSNGSGNGNGDQDEGVWSMSGDSPTSLSVDPLNGVPSCLSSIWSDLEDPKDLFPRRSASISVPGAENADSLNMSNHHQQQHSWTSGAAMDQHQRNHNGGHAIAGSVSQRRFSTAPTTTGLYRQVVQNMLSLNGASAAVGSGGGAVCTVCQKRPVQALFQPCNHRCFCGICATRLCQMPKPTCPLCQAPIASSMMIDPTPKQQQRSAS